MRNKYLPYLIPLNMIQVLPFKMTKVIERLSDISSFSVYNCEKGSI